MSGKSEVNSYNPTVLWGVLIGAVIGGILGLILNSLYSIKLFGIPGTWIILGIAAGILIGAIAGSKKSDDEFDKSASDTFDRRNTDSRLELKKEELDISKRKVETCRVDSHIETVTEEKTITVPIKRKELVIEKTTLGNKDNDAAEEIRIPISEEQVDVTKNPVELMDVSIYKNKIQDVEHIEGPLKEEKLRVKTKGDAVVKMEKTKENK